MKISVRLKMILCFIVPIFFMLVIGLSAYNKAQDGMEQKYVDSTLETVSMAAEHIDLVSSFVKSEAITYAYNDSLIGYTGGLYNNDLYQKGKAIDNIKKDILTSQSTNSFVKNIHIVTDKDIQMFSTKTTSELGMLPEYKELVAIEGKKNAIVNWIDSHELIDGPLKISGSESYIFAYEVLASNNKSIIIFDIAKDSIQDFLDTIDLGNGSVISLVTMNGKEVFHESVKEGDTGKYDEAENVFYGQSFYEEMLADIEAEITEGSKTVTIDGESYLFFYAVCDISGTVMCAAVPLSTITAEAASIKTLTYILVAVSTIIVLLIGILISGSIRNNVSRISKALGKVAEGDLTVKVKVKGHDEFRGLAAAATDMVSNTKKLVEKVDNATEALEVSAENVKTASDDLGECSREISDAVNDITEGMSRQSRHADECVQTTDKLSDEIANVTELVSQVRSMIAETNDMIERGVGIINTLGNQTNETTEVTGKVVDSIEELRVESSNINNFVGVITSISAQTNLLSLNASIEAARAGEAGRGFAVVAEEIRKLADESASAAGEINKIVEKIGIQTKISVDSAEKASAIVDVQTKLVKDTVDVFSEMQAHMEELIGGLEEIRVATESADERRVEAVDAVRNISRIIEETAENTQTVIDVSEKLKNNVDNLDKTAGELGDSMSGLKSEVEVFKI